MLEEKRKQVIDQCRVVMHLAGAIADVHRDLERIYEAGSRGMDEGFFDLVGERTARLMETLGDILNGMDAAEEVDEWTAPIFAKAHSMFPIETDEVKTDG